ncbi:MAG: HlyD family secretion protein [Lawsonibacter sp.]
MKKIKYGLIVGIPILICVIAVSIRVAVPKSETITIEGDVEIDVRPYYVQVSGEVTSLPVGVGQTVHKGDILATIDDSQAQYELEQLNCSLLKAQAALRDLDETENQALKQAQMNVAKNNVTIARQSLAAAQDTLGQLKEEYDKLQTLLDAGIATQSDVDAMADSVSAQEKAVAIAAAQLSSAKEQVTIAGIDTQADMTEKIAMAQADVDSIQSQIDFAQSQLKNYTILALDDGVVISTSYDEGGIAISGTQMCEVSKENQKKFVFYLPEEYIDDVDYGTVITVTAKPADKNTAAREYTATVEYIDLKAEYTPKDSESSANKNRLSFKIKAVLESDCDLRVAEKADVTLGHDGNG